MSRTVQDVTAGVQWRIFETIKNLCRVRPPHLVIQQRKGNTGQKVWFLILLIHTITDACDPGLGST